MIMYVCSELLEKAMESTYLHVINVFFEYLFNDLAHRRYHLGLILARDLEAI